MKNSKLTSNDVAPRKAEKERTIPRAWTTIRVISILLGRTRWLTLFPYPPPVLLQSSTLRPRTWSFRFLLAYAWKKERGRSTSAQKPPRDWSIGFQGSTTSPRKIVEEIPRKFDRRKAYWYNGSSASILGSGASMGNWSIRRTRLSYPFSRRGIHWIRKYSREKYFFLILEMFSWCIISSFPIKKKKNYLIRIVFVYLNAIVS